MLGLKKKFSILVILSTLGYALSFGNQLVISYYFGTKSSLDAYWAALGIANFLCFYLHPLKESLIPAIFKNSKISIDQASLLLSSSLSLMGYLVLLSSLVILFFPNTLILMLRDSSSSGHDLLALLPWFVPFIFLFTLSETLNAVLLGFNKNLAQATSRLIASIGSLATLILLSKPMGINAMVISLLLNQTIVLLISYWSIRKIPLKLKWVSTTHIRNANVLSVFGSLLISYLIAQFYVLLERNVMMQLKPGLLSSYQYSTTLVNTLLSILAFPLANLLWHKFLEANHHADTERAKLILFRALGILFILLLVICTFSFINAKSIIFLIYSRGAFDTTSLEVTSNALKTTIFAAIPIGLSTVIGRYLISSQHPRNAALIGLAISFASISLILISYSIQSSTLIQWNWLGGNLLGLIASLFFVANDASKRELSKAVSFALHSITVVTVAALLAPDFASELDSKLHVLLAMSLNFICFMLILLGVAFVSKFTQHIRNLISPYAT